MNTAQTTSFVYAQLERFTQAVFLKMGCPPEAAAQATEALLKADLRGIDSHGIARLTGYVRLWKAGRVNANPQIALLHETPSTATLDADAALGLVAAPHAMQLAIAKAKAVGSGWVAVQNSNHFGIAGYHAMLALEHNMIGIATTNASALVAPTFGKERMLGTNPFAFAIPAGRQPAFVADFATTTAANGKLELLQRKGLATPVGWLQNADGLATQDAHGLKNGGALLPLGSDRERSSHKGYALGAVADILSGVLSGAAFGPWAPPFPAYVPLPPNPPGKGLGHFFGAMRIDGFGPADAFLERMDLWIERFRETEPINAAEPVQIPGDAERHAEEERLAHGIPVFATVVDELNALAAELELPLLGA